MDEKIPVPRGLDTVRPQSPGGGTSDASREYLRGILRAATSDPRAPQRSFLAVTPSSPEEKQRIHDALRAFQVIPTELGGELLILAKDVQKLAEDSAIDSGEHGAPIRIQREQSVRPAQRREPEEKKVPGVEPEEPQLLLSDVLKAGREVVKEKGQDIFRTEDPATDVWLITSGAVQLHRLDSEGSTLFADLALAGDIIGYTTQKKHAWTATTSQQATLRVAQKATVDRTVGQSRKAAAELMAQFEFQLQKSRELSAVVHTDPASSRIAAFLLWLKKNSPQSDKGEGKLEMPCSAGELSALLGIAGETVSRTMTALESSGVLVKVATRIYRIPDMAKLGELARQ